MYCYPNYHQWTLSLNENELVVVMKCLADEELTDEEAEMADALVAKMREIKENKEAPILKKRTR